jgi:hypothetical protein
MSTEKRLIEAIPALRYVYLVPRNVAGGPQA